MFFFQNLEAFAEVIVEDGQLALANPDELVGDEKTLAETSEVLSAVTGVEEQFGFAFTALETYLREQGWAHKDDMASVPSWLKAMQ